LPSELTGTLASVTQQGQLTSTSADGLRVAVRDLADGQAVDDVFVIRERQQRRKRNGDAFLKLRLGDASGTLDALVWEAVDELAPACPPGAVVRVRGAVAVHERYGKALTVRSLRAAEEHEYRPDDLAEGPSVPCDQMLQDLEDLVATIQEPHLRALLDGFFAPGAATRERWSEAPAAKHYHQAYRHGLLEHSLSVAQGVSAMSALFPGIDRDVAVAGALLHDVGKIEAYVTRAEGSIELTDAGRLEGEIPLGYYLIRRAIEDLPGFPPDVARALLHIVLSHHGQLEHGSPVVPCTREATLVHFVDNLGGRLGSFDRIEKALPDGQRWSEWDRALSAAAYFAPREDARRAA
jgi:3'-5' exoribonuclease